MLVQWQVKLTFKDYRDSCTANIMTVNQQDAMIYYCNECNNDHKWPPYGDGTQNNGFIGDI